MSDHKSHCCVEVCSGSLRDLIQNHGTPEEFATATINAIGLISPGEAVVAVLEYTEEFYMAMMKESIAEELIKEVFARRDRLAKYTKRA